MLRKIRGRGPMGFTLIELLVVIAVIAILAAILFPVFARAKNQAVTTQCSSNLMQIAKAVLMYATDHGGGLPRLCSVTASGTEDWGHLNSALLAQSATYQDLRSYLKSDKILQCPACPVDSSDFMSDGVTRYQIDYRFNETMVQGANFQLHLPPTMKKLDQCTYPQDFYIVSDRHSRNHYDRNLNEKSDWVMLMVMADTHMTTKVKPYNPAWVDSQGNFKYNHWDFPSCHTGDINVRSQYPY